MVDTPMSPEEVVWPVASGGEEAVTLGDALTFLRRQFWLIVGIIAAAALAAVIYIFLTPSEYVARADLLIEPGKQHALWQDSGVLDLTIDNAQVESQVEVLHSERIADDVIRSLNLIGDPEFHGSGTNYERQRAALAHFESALTARRVGQSYVIEVAFRSLDPEKAARITNAVTAAYLHEQQQASQDVAQQASQWMEKQVTELGVQLNDAAKAAQEFRVSHGISDTAGNNGQPQLIDKLTQLEAKAQAYRKVYESLLERFTENQQQASYPVSNARVITSASRPLTKAYPKSKLILLLSLLLGAIIGTAVAAARATLEGSIRSAKQIRHSVGLSVLGLLPRGRSDSAPNLGGDCWVEVLDAPLSPFSDAMRDAKISVQHACGRSGCSLGILSVSPDDAAGAVAANLAALFEASGTKTLLIDADLRDRRLTRRLMPDATAGLAEALRRGGADAVRYERKTKASFLPAGPDLTSPDVADLLDSPVFPALLTQLKREFGTILLDLPALRRTADARAVAPHLDGCLLVCTYGRTSVRALQEVVDQLRADNVMLLGALVTEVSDHIPPLFGCRLGEVRELGYIEFISRRLIAARSRVRGASR